MRQNFAQSQQRCAEWEKKYKEHEAEIERLTTMIDQSEQSKGQLETDLSLARLQIEEHDSEVRMSKVCHKQPLLLQDNLKAIAGT